MPINLKRSPRVAVVQDGARLHYALPIALHRAGLLEAVFTDWFTKRGSPVALAAKLVSLVDAQAAKRMAGRCCPELDDVLIFTSRIRALRMHLEARRIASADRPAFSERQAREMGGWISRRGLPRIPRANVLQGFIRNVHPTLWEQGRHRGLLCVGDQMIAPHAIEVEEARRQQERFPGWEPPATPAGIELTIRGEEESWSLLDHITCASEYVRDGLIAQGQPTEKISVLPYPIDWTHFRRPNPVTPPAPGLITIGFVGAVGLRKGVPYFFEVARQFDPQKVRFVLVGPVQLDASVLERHRGQVEVVGAVPRVKVMEYIARFDIFFFPSTCEGSAGSIMEAMAMAQPVVCSPNSGSVVRNGQEGFIRAYDDIEGARSALTQLIENPELRRDMGQRALARAQSYDLGYYGRALAELLCGLLASRSGNRGA